MRILVTGGAGFIGSHVVDDLVDRGIEAVVVDRLHEAAHGEVPEHLNPGAEQHVLDLRQTERMVALLEDVDAVCHLAAMVGLGRGFEDAPAYVADNDLGTASLLAAVQQAGGVDRLVLGGSMVVYGEGRYRCGACGPVRPAPRRTADLEAGRYEPPCPGCGAQLVPVAVPETAGTDPRSVYAATKLAQEQLCRVFAHQQEAMHLTVLRYHNVYGPRMPRDTGYAGVASIFRSALEAGRAPRVFEDGAQLRDFVHVDDVARATVRSLLRPEPAPGTFNIASGTPRTVLEMAEALAAAFGDGPEPEVVGGHRPGDVRHVFAATERARDVLGFEAEIDLATGMASFARAPLREPAGS